MLQLVTLAGSTTGQCVSFLPQAPRAPAIPHTAIRPDAALAAVRQAVHKTVILVHATHSEEPRGAVTGPQLAQTLLWQDLAPGVALRAQIVRQRARLDGWRVADHLLGLAVLVVVTLAGDDRANHGQPENRGQGPLGVAIPGLCLRGAKPGDQDAQGCNGSDEFAVCRGGHVGAPYKGGGSVLWQPVPMMPSSWRASLQTGNNAPLLSNITEPNPLWLLNITARKRMMET